jgi:hypothetical protein
MGATAARAEEPPFLWRRLEALLRRNSTVCVRPVGRGTRGAFALAIATLAAACAPSAAPQQAPKIVFQETAHDFGHVAQGTTVRHVYAFRNPGGLPLTIDNVRSSCRCTAVVTPQRVVPPGSAGTIEAIFDTADAFGQKTRSIIVYSNDPSQPVTTLTLSGYIDAEAAADPPRLYVGHVSRGQAVANDVRLVGKGFPPDLLVSNSGKVFKVDAYAAAPGVGWRLRVTIMDTAPAGRFKEVISVGRSNSRPLRIPVTGFVDGDARASANTAENTR